MKRMTPLRQAIIEALEVKHLLTAPQLLELLKVDHPNVNKTTIYRALEYLLAEGQVCRHNLVGADISFELRHHHHDHLVCLDCGQVQTAECVFEPPKEVNGFKIEHHHITLYGYCPACQAKRALMP